jgi:hypothetical protein
MFSQNDTKRRQTIFNFQYYVCVCVYVFVCVLIDCALGSLTPQTINCGYLTSRKSRGEVDVADAENSDASSIESNSTVLLEEDNEIMGKECGTPTKIDEMLLYKNEVMLPDSDEGYPTGTEITFDCIPSITGEKTTWKIICEDGSWIGRSVGCGKLKRRSTVS